MKTIHLSRREFLKTTGLSVSGFILGYSWTDAGDSDAGSFHPNAFIVINKSDGITLYISVPEIGQNTRTAIAMILSDELGADLNAVKIKQAPPRSDMGWQTAAGSNGMRMSWDNLRKSAAAAREMLVRGTALHWNVKSADCRTDNSMVIGPGGRSMSFVDAIPHAQKQSIPEDPPLKAANGYKYISQPVKVLDAREIGMGKTLFGSDAMPENVRFAVMVRCPVHGGKIKSYDDSSARQMRDVLDVLRVDEKIAVVARNTWAAINASHMVTVEWDEGPNAGSSTERLVEQQKNAVRDAKQKGFSLGSFADAYAASAIKLEKEFSAPLLTHAPMEPLTCTAWYRDGGVEIWGTSQSLNRLYNMLPDLTGLPHEKITYHQLRIGGGFGRKQATDFFEEALGIAKHVDYPVKLIYTREDDIRHGRYRAPDRYRYRVGMMQNGFPTALEESSARRTKLQEPSDISLYFPNVQRQCTFVELPVANGPMRAPNHNVTSFTEQSMIDCMAQAVRIDPMEYRLALHGDKDAMNNLGWEKAPCENPTMVKLLRIVKKRSDYMSDPDYGYGVVHFTKYGTRVAIVALAPKSGRGKPIEKVFLAVYCGRVINPLGAKAQMEGGIVDGIAAAMYQKVEIRNGSIVQSNFHDYKLLEMQESPEMDITLLESDDPPDGIGEMAYPPMMAATANAIFAATGVRTTDLPIKG